MLTIAHCGPIRLITAFIVAVQLSATTQLHSVGNGGHPLKEEKSEESFTALGKRQQGLYSADMYDYQPSFDYGITCRPISQLVKIPQEPGYSIHPEFIMLNRCGGGGCGSAVTSCVAKDIERKKINVMVERTGGTQHQTFRVIELEEHTSCHCGCTIIESNCTAGIHKYDADSCRCDCVQKNKGCPAGKQWSHHACSCTCIATPSSCKRNENFDDIQCKCTVSHRCYPIAMTTRNTWEPKISGYISKDYVPL